MDSSSLEAEAKTKTLLKLAFVREKISKKTARRLALAGARWTVT
jgi:hypothetical protein